MSRTHDTMKSMTRWFMAISCLLMLGLPQAMAAPGDASSHGTVWEKWQPLAAGYVGRRRVPEGLELPKDERQPPSTQAHDLKLPGVSTKGDSSLKPGKAASVWVYTGAAGLYSVSLTDLGVVTGINPNMLRSSAKKGRFRFLNADAPVSWYFDTAGDRLLFTGEKYDTAFSNTNAYQLQQTKKADPNQMTEVGPSHDNLSAGLQTPFRDDLLFQEQGDLMYVLWLDPQHPDAPYWFWDYLYAPSRPTISVPLYIPAPMRYGTARIQVQLHGFTDVYPGDDHQVTAELNGYPIGSGISWDGLNPALFVADVDQAFLEPDGHNVLTLSSQRGGQFLKSVSVTYDRRPVAENDQLWMRNVSEGTQEVTGFTGSDILVVESPVRNAVLHRDVDIYPAGDGTWAVSFSAESGSDYLVVETSALQAPAMDGRQQANLTAPENAADYLIIAPREFSGAAQALADYREGSYGRTKVVWLDDIYKSFSAGRQDPFAIGRFMDDVRTQWTQAPSAVTLVGKGSIDYKDCMGYGDDFLPVVMTANPWALSDSDTRLLGSEDGVTSFAIGRLPITNDEEGMEYVNKLMAHERQLSQGTSNQAVVVADNPDSGGDFHASADQLATELLGLNFASIMKLYHPTDSVRASLINPETWDSDFISYFGHGSPTQVGDYRENFIRAADANVLNNTMYPIFAALTCAAGSDAMPGTRSLAGALVLNPQGGAIVSVASTGGSLNDDSLQLASSFVDNLYGGNSTVGDALVEAKEQTSGDIGDYMAPIFSIIGEPGVHAR